VVGGSRQAWSKHPEWQPSKQQPQSAVFNPVEEARKQERIRKRLMDKLLRRLVDQHMVVNRNGQPACGACGAPLPAGGPADVERILEHIRNCRIISDARAIIDRNQQYGFVAGVLSRKPLRTIVIGDGEIWRYLEMAATSVGFWGRVSLVGWAPLVELLAQNAKRTFGVPLAVKVEGNGNSGAVATLELAPTKKPTKTPGSTEKASEHKTQTRKEPAKTPEPPSLSQIVKGEVKGEFQYGNWTIRTK
jgi:hypothetical protein